MDEVLSCLKFFSPDHVYNPVDHQNFYIEEKSKGGEGKAFFSSSGQCVVIKAGTSGPLLWSLKNGKIGEGAIITKDDSGYHLHLLEMKSKLTSSEWAKAVLQFEGMHLTSLAVARLLGVLEVQSVTCYIAFKEDAVSNGESADLVLLKTFVGIPNPIGGGDAWSIGSLDLPFTGSASLQKAQRDANADAHFGAIN